MIVTNKSTLPYLALTFGILTIASSAILIRLAGAPGPVISFYRMSIATVVLTIPFLQKAKSQHRLSKAGVWMALLAGLFFGLDLAAWSTGVMLTGATNPTLMANTAPIWVGLGAMLIFKEKLNVRFWAGLILAILGAAVILGLDLQQGINFGLGSLYGLLAAIFYGAFFLSTQRGRETLDSLSFFWFSAFSASLVLLFFVISLGQSLTDYSPFTFMLFIANGVIIQAIGWLAITYAQGHLPASLVSPTLLGQPAITGILAGPLLGEYLTGWQSMGGIAILVGVIIVHRSRA